ncbi:MULTISPECIES: FAD:protein FMN transferase [unclassified Streptomyces]|uniref:FAD:protein FMN transferase n=1 Tax=unclassified Streptomyces TaxID=2593676 RepID=UPI0028C39E75|nr:MULTISPECIES: FAD:protein FMN transferase [unclassified Streptomyces]WNO75635.1 FAD:protein FMN transferase [Streptomyces sp. AM8-1-1]
MSGGTRLRHVEHSMGTVFSFDIRMAAADSPRVRAGLAAAVAGLHRVDEIFSTYREDSQISRLARHEITLDDCVTEVAEVFRLCEEAERESDGWFTARYAGGVDPTGVVKGWAVECAVRMLASSGADAVCLNGGGDIQLHGGPWRVGVSDPLHPGELVTVIEADDGLAVATSGPAERGCHILDPHTRRPPADGIASMTVVCPGLTEADARATAAYAMGDRARGWLEDLAGTEAFAVLADGSTWQTSGFARHCAQLPA